MERQGRSEGRERRCPRCTPIHAPQSAEGGSSAVARPQSCLPDLRPRHFRIKRFRNEVRFPEIQSPLPKNPRWYGFNLLEYFSTDADWMKYFPYKNDGMFLEDDFRWIRDWGFNWVRLPMDYRFWTAPDLFTIDEKRIEPIDRAIRLGEKYGIHVNVCLHRAPGLCILDTMDEKLTGIAVTKERTNVFTIRTRSMLSFTSGLSSPIDTREFRARSSASTW